MCRKWTLSEEPFSQMLRVRPFSNRSRESGAVRSLFRGCPPGLLYQLFGRFVSRLILGMKKAGAFAPALRFSAFEIIR